MKFKDKLFIFFMLDLVLQKISRWLGEEVWFKDFDVFPTLLYLLLLIYSFTSTKENKND
jgi:hypothetical protein